jgi:L-histidine N-alpha-methyltransferase
MTEAPATAQRTAGAPAAETDERARFRLDVYAGLGAGQKTLPAKYFYDEAGSRLFDAICALDEYYLTRTETGILARHAAAITAGMGEHPVLVEFGAGSSVKVRLLLDALPSVRAFMPIDISGEHLLASCAQLAHAYPRLHIIPVVGDFTQTIDLSAVAPTGLRTGFFPGSTIGNFGPARARDLLAGMARVLGRRARLVIGVDLVKSTALLEAAYDDANGVTAAFNLNLLERINRELDADFRLDRFRHKAFFNATESRIEMHLESLRAQNVRVGTRTFSFAAGETIHTENSYKYTLDSFAALADAAGWRTRRTWTDDSRLFSVHLLQADG